MVRRLHSLHRLSAKLAAAAVVLGLVLAASATVLFLQDRDDFAATRLAALSSIQAERGKVQAALDRVPHRLEKITADIATGQERVRQIAGVIAQLKDLDSTWDKLTGDAQQRANSERREKLEQQRVEAAAGLAALQQDYTRTGWERDGLELELGRLEGQQKAVEGQSKGEYYLSQTWNYRLGGMKVSGWVGVLIGLGLFGLTVVGIAMERPDGRGPGAKR